MKPKLFIKSEVTWWVWDVADSTIHTWNDFRGVLDSDDADTWEEALAMGLQALRKALS